jgi:hypothetical protein
VASGKMDHATGCTIDINAGVVMRFFLSNTKFISIHKSTIFVKWILNQLYSSGRTRNQSIDGDYLFLWSSLFYLSCGRGSDTPKSKSNWAKAMLIFYVIRSSVRKSFEPQSFAFLVAE